MLLVLIKRFLGKAKPEVPLDGRANSLEQLVLTAQRGDIRLRNDLITDYQPYIAKMTSRFCRRYIDPSRDDEYSVALDAFHEAIQHYSPISGRSFLSFAETVIRRRLIDYVRKEQKFNQQLPYSSFDAVDEDNQVVNPVDHQIALQQYEESRVTEERKQEIMALTQELSKYGIAFSDLVDHSPKHTDSRLLLFGVARVLAKTNELMALMTEKGQLPVKQLLSQVDVSRKTIERNRKYIITVALILHGSYPYLQEYISEGTQPDGKEER